MVVIFLRYYHCSTVQVLSVHTKEINIFLKITKKQLKLYEEEVVHLKYKGESIIEFAATPLFDKSIKINDFHRKNLEKTIKKSAKNSKNT